MTTPKKTVRDVITERMELVLNDESLKFNKEQLEAIRLALIPTKTGGTSQPKENEDGDIYCNYYKEYLSPELFKKLPNGKYPPLSIEGTKHKQKLLTLDKQMNREISKAFIEGIDINREEVIAKYAKLKEEVA